MLENNKESLGDIEVNKNVRKSEEMPSITASGTLTQTTKNKY